jgi:hypothetical protein
MYEDLDPLMEEYGIDALLTTGSAFVSPNIYWLTGFRSSDEIIYLKNHGDDPLVAAWLLAVERLRKESFITKTHDVSDIVLKLFHENKVIQDNMDRIYKSLLKTHFSGG